jgi:hypothetical protein
MYTSECHASVCHGSGFWGSGFRGSGFRGFSIWGLTITCDNIVEKDDDCHSATVPVNFGGGVDATRVQAIMWNDGNQPQTPVTSDMSMDVTDV